jgi:hypothetical protein
MEVPVMAHFAELDDNNVVLRVIVVSNEMLRDENGVESEAAGISFCHLLFGADTRWMQTSYNGNFRKNYAAIGDAYDAARDAFIAPIPEGDGWILDEETCQWRNPELEAAQAAVQTGVTRV